MSNEGQLASVLFGITAFRISGGIASVNRAIYRTLSDSCRQGLLERVDVVSLLADQGSAGIPRLSPGSGAQLNANGSKARFVWQLSRSARQHHHDWLLFDLVGLARCVTLPLSNLPPNRLAIFTHWHELTFDLTERHYQALQRADRLLTNSQFSARQLQKQFPEFEEKIRPVPLCIDPQRVDQWEASNEPPPPRRRSIALIVSRLNAAEGGKGHDTLIAAWPKVLEGDPSAELWIVGGGSGQAELEQLVRMKGLDGSIRFLGVLDQTQLHRLYQEATVYVMPSTQEGFGLVYAEAMFHQMPCIGSDADAASEIIVDGETGWIVPYADVERLTSALLSAFADPRRCEEYGAAGRDRVLQHYRFEAFGQRFLRALDLPQRPQIQA